MASDTWFRMYNTAVDHPKVMMLTDANFRAWVQLMSLASKLGGVIPPDMPLIAATIRKTVSKATATVQALVDAVLLDPLEGGGWSPHNWKEKQFKSDVSTERVKRFRERSRNVSETPHKQSTETETEDTSLRSVSPPQAADTPPPKPRSKPKPQEPDGFAEFYAEYPLHKARPAAAKAYSAALSRASPGQLLDGARRYAAARSTEDPKFTKHPATWLNQDCWLDEDTPTNDHARRTKNGDFLRGVLAAVEQVHDEAGPPEGPDDWGGDRQASLALPPA